MSPTGSFNTGLSMDSVGNIAVTGKGSFAATVAGDIPIIATGHASSTALTALFSNTSDTGYGVSAIVFFGRRVSAEFAAAYVKTGIDLEARGRDAGPFDRTIDVGGGE